MLTAFLLFLLLFIVIRYEIREKDHRDTMRGNEAAMQHLLATIDRRAPLNEPCVPGQGALL